MRLRCSFSWNNINAHVNYLHQWTYLLFLLDWLKIETAEESLAEKKTEEEICFPKLGEDGFGSLFLAQEGKLLSVTTIFQPDYSNCP